MTADSGMAAQGVMWYGYAKLAGMCEGICSASP